MFGTTCYMNTWKRFVNEGILESSRLNKRIMESWYRCKQEDVNPYLSQGQHILTNGELIAQKEKNSLFLNAALSPLEKMKEVIEESKMMALLVDPEGYVLSLTGNKGVLHDARKINFVEGVRWTEQEVGTNAIGTALQTGEAVMISGTEHYSVASHHWSCSAAPIYSDDRKLLGIIDVSCPVNSTHPFMLGMVASLAHSIERELSVRAHKHKMELIHKCIDFIEINQPLIICDDQKTVVASSKSVRQRIPNVVGMRVNELLPYGFRVETESPVFSENHKNVIGTCLHLSEEMLRKPDEPFVSAFSSKSFYFEGETGTSQAFQRTLHDMKRVALTDASVYILGETGTGKELVAKAIHENSSRKDGPFIALNCGAIPKELMESELFGYVEGAFTGAKRQGYKGKFEQANNGTLFLDEIGEIPPSMQVALLRVLQERKVTPVGGIKEISLNIRIITATHRDLLQLVHEGTFREDLYYRLHVYPMYVPSLRDRKEDIPRLVRYFCQKNNWTIKWPDECFDRLMQYEWPGNIRELFNVLERLQIVSPNGSITPLQISDLLPELNTRLRWPASSISDGEQTEPSTQLTLREKIQKDLMMEALQKTKGNVTMAAKLLDIPRSTFYKRLQKFNL
ncbi:sigma-54-dependent Fis family transcriptional regulator [Priestia abyssalis]|uniref:sigma-54-dependent Fis family transcriptional regulator n=1 Tax=Priestia abyssalis TaxID=1221450 RepID=UPI00099581B9|nr:sigma-54-dependent Fis family transcriptional regulator [Priestia abyssalis]